MAGMFDFLSGFGGGKSPSQGPNGVGDAGYQTPDQLQTGMLPSLGFDSSKLLGAYTSGATPTGAWGGAGGANTTGLGAGLGFNVGTGQLAMSGLSALGNLWSAYQAQSLGKQQLAMTKDFGNANIANQIKSYNTTLSDRESARGQTEGLSPDQVAAYVKANSLTR